MKLLTLLLMVIALGCGKRDKKEVIYQEIEPTQYNEVVFINELGQSEGVELIDEVKSTTLMYKGRAYQRVAEIRDGYFDGRVPIQLLKRIIKKERRDNLFFYQEGDN